jgi:multisubunit Na+/H+ antiporter MnhF subunit
MTNQSLPTAAKFVALVASLPVFWVVMFLGTYFLMALGAIALGPVNEEMMPSILKVAMIVAGVAMTWCFYNEMRGGGLQDPITALKNIGKFALASLALPILWFGVMFATSFVLVILGALIGFVDVSSLESNPETFQTVASISAVVGGVIVTALLIHQWKHKKKDLFLAVIGSVMLMLSMFSG